MACEDVQRASVSAQGLRRYALSVAKALPFALGILGLVYYLLSLSPYTSGVDDTIYMLLATAISKGQFLRAIHVVGSPPMQYPVGLPLLVAPVVWLFPDFPANLVYAELVPLAFAVLAIPLGYRLLQNQFAQSTTVLTLLVAWAALNYASTWYWTHVLMTEGVYLFFSLAALLLASRIVVNRGKEIGYAIGAGLCAAAAYYMRIVGLCLIAAVLAWLALRRRWRAVAVAATVFALLILPLVIREQLTGNSLALDFYGRQFLLRDFWHPEQGSIQSPWELIPRLVNNLLGHARESLPLLFFPTFTGTAVMTALSRAGLEWVPFAAGVGALLLMAAGFVARLVQRGPGLIELYVILYMAMILAPPWVTYRNLIPILIFLGAYLAEGATLLGRWFERPGHRRKWGFYLVVGILGLSLASNLISGRHNLSAGAQFRAHGLYFRAPERSVDEAAAWIRQNTPPEAIVFFRSPEEIYLRTGRQTVPALASNLPYPIGLRPLDEVMQVIREQVDFVVVVDSPDDWQPRIRQAIEGDEQAFRPIYRTSEQPPVIVYAVLR